MQFSKYHALGNDYIVVDPVQAADPLTPARVRRICHRQYGVGSDGILLGPFPASEADFDLRIFNPDGSEAEKSGNGLRIFARYLWDRSLVGPEPFVVATPGGHVICQVHDSGESVAVNMGKASFDSAVIPVAGTPREVVNEQITIEDEELCFCAATVGNPHCVVLRDSVSAHDARHWGPVIENDPRFPNRTNVQFIQVLGRSDIRIEIWERGAGYTLASGTSACAASAVAQRLGVCDARIAVHMPGGTLNISVSNDLSLSMRGPATKVYDGTIADELLRGLD